jgi:hypothetical protein
MGSTAMVDQVTESNTATWSESCTIATPAICVQSMGGPDAGDLGQVTTTLQPSESVWLTVDVTAGAELLAQATGKPKSTSTGKGGSTSTAGGSPTSTNAAGRSWVGVTAVSVAVGAFVAMCAL